MATLHEKGIIHRDLNNGNIRWQQDDTGYHFELIDLNRMKFYPEGTLPPQRVCLQNLTLFCELTPPVPLLPAVLSRLRHWPSAVIEEALRIKRKHDKHWKRKKRWKRMLKL